MNYGLNARVFSWAFTSMMKDYYRKNFPDVDIDDLSSKVKKEYRAMIERTPGIGGSSNEENLVGACYFFSMAKVIPGLTPDILDDMISFGMKSKLMVKAHEGKRKKGVIFSEKEQSKKLNEAERSHTSKYEMDWEFNYEPGEDEFHLTYTRCGVLKLAERENVMEFLPCMCHLDFPKYEMLGGKLYRTKTLADGDDVCNFHVVRIK